MFLFYTQWALKRLWKKPWINLAILFVLALTFSIVILYLLWLRNEWAYDAHIPNNKRLFRFTVEVNNPENNHHSHFARAYQNWISKLPDFFPSIESMTRLSRINENTVKYNDKLFQVRFHEADSNFLQIFGIKLLQGNPESAFRRPGTVILSKSVSVKIFGSVDPVGKILQMYCRNCLEKKEYEVTGIMQDIPATSHFQLDILSPFEKPDEIDWAYYYFLLKAGSNTEDILKGMPDFLKRNVGEQEAQISTCHLENVRDIHLRSAKDRELRENSSMKSVWIFTGITLFVMLVSLIHFFNLRLSLSQEMEKPSRVMLVFGAGKKDWFWHSFTEVLIICILSVNISWVILELFQSSYNQFTGNTINLSDIFHDPFIVTCLLGLLMTIIITGIIPVFMFRRSIFKKVITDSNWTILKKKMKLSRALIVVQFTVAILMIGSALTIQRQTNLLMEQRLGNKMNHILCIRNLPVQVVDHYQLFRESLLKSPLIEEVTAGMEDPADEALDKFRFDTEGVKKGNKDQLINVYPAGYNFFRFYHIPVVAGNDFPETSVDDTIHEDYIINESAAQMLGWTPQEAVGRSFILLTDFLPFKMFHGGKIIGVVKDFHTGSARNKIEPTVYFQKKVWMFSCQTKIDTSRQEEALQWIRQNWEKFYPDYPLEIAWVDQMYDQLYQQEIRQKELLTIFTGVALLISCLGIWSIANLVTRKRTKEIGIRKVNGASSLSVLWMLSKDFLSLVILAILLALPVFHYGMKLWLQNYAHPVSLSWDLYCIPAMVAILGAVLTVGWNSISTAWKNPVESLRYE